MSSLNDWKTVTVNPEKLRLAYDRAVAKRAQQFTFEGNDYLTDYAKYLLEYIELKNEENRQSNIIHS